MPGIPIKRKVRLQINQFILNAVLKKRPVFRSYKKLGRIRRKIGKDSIDYVDFEWKYFQYYHGNRDLNIEKSRDNSSTVTFSDLPMDVLEKVVKKLDPIDCLKLRKVSRGLRNLVDSTEIHCDRIDLHWGKIFWLKTREESRNMYHRVKGECCPIETHQERVLLHEKAQAVIMGTSKSDIQLGEKWIYSDALTFLKNPKLTIERIEIDQYDDGSDEFAEILNSQKVQLNVRKICVSNEKDDVLLPVIKCLKPGCLEEIHRFSLNVEDEQWDEIMETEQWKMAKKFCYSIDISEPFPAEKMLHFKEIRIFAFEFSDENLVMVSDILLKSSCLEFCYLEREHYLGDITDSDDDEDAEERILGIFSQKPAYNSETRRFAIPDSRDYFQLELIDDADLISMSFKRCSES